MQPSALDNRKRRGPTQLILTDDKRQAAYSAYYETLSQLREEFHRTGRFDDANVKLDEIIKLLAISIHEARRSALGETDRFSIPNLERLAADRFGDSSKIALALRDLSEEVLGNPTFKNPDGTSIFGAHSSLNVPPTENEFAKRIVLAVCAIAPHFAAPPDKLLQEFDILNETFGHFVRDNFTQTKEDAQYMTPTEVVMAMTEIAFAGIEKSDMELRRILDPNHDDPYVVLDPTCGVGSFLVQALRRMTRAAEARGVVGDDLLAIVERLRNFSIHGQDKVDRMVRLSKMNLLLFGGGVPSISQGNSIDGTSSIDALAGKVDLILTNPPFGAEFDVDELLGKSPPDRYPMLRDLRETRSIPRTVDSELVLLDRCLSLLRPGGRLVIVLPDKVVSSKAKEAAVRKWLERVAELIAVVELPSVTFAQAGTRTRTSFVYLRKLPRPSAIHAEERTFMAVCEDIGYEVVERVGAPIKIPGGTNELGKITEAFRRSSGSPANNVRPYSVVNEKPSAVWVRRNAFINGRWTPRFYHTRRLAALSHLEKLSRKGFGLRQLSSIAELCSAKRRGLTVPTHTRVISVLHVSSYGTVDMNEVASYAPKTGGFACSAGEVLFSKINPRIPRICVVPEAEFPLACSTEFEILKPLEMDPYLLVALLKTPPVQEQVQHLTSGTSSSHNRIKDSELAEILVPVPRKGSKLAKDFAAVGKSLRKSVQMRYQIDAAMRAASDKLRVLVS